MKHQQTMGTMAAKMMQVKPDKLRSNRGVPKIEIAVRRGRWGWVWVLSCVGVVVDQGISRLSSLAKKQAYKVRARYWEKERKLQNKKEKV